MKKKLVIFFLSIFLFGFSTNACLAQINESDSVKYQLKTSLSGNYQSGNVNVLITRAKMDFSVKLNRHFVFKTQNATLFQSFSGKKVDNDLFCRNFIYYDAHNRFYPFGIAYISSNFRRKIKDRYFAGLGATYQAVREKNNVLKLSFNMVYESTNFDATQFNFDEYNGLKQIALWRSTLYLAGWHYMHKNTIKLYYDAYYQPSWTSRINYRSQFDLGIDMSIWKGLAFTILYTVTHENVVPIKIVQNDKILTFGLNFTMKKIH